MKVYVVGYEPIPEKSSVGGFDWFYKKEDADKCFDEEITTSEGHIVYRGEVEISNNVTERDDITSLVDLFLEENDWENSFK